MQKDYIVMQVIVITIIVITVGLAFWEIIKVMLGIR